MFVFFLFSLRRMEMAALNNIINAVSTRGTRVRTDKGGELTGCAELFMTQRLLNILYNLYNQRVERMSQFMNRQTPERYIHNYQVERKWQD